MGAEEERVLPEGRNHRKDRPAGSRELTRASGALKSEGYGLIIELVASEQELPIVCDPRSLRDLVSFSESFLKKQVRCFHDLLRQRPAPSFILLEWSSISLSSLYNLTM
jgi:hypothetical protein